MAVLSNGKRTELHELVMTYYGGGGDSIIEQIRECVRRIDPNSTDKFHCTPLFYAHTSKVVDALVEAGANVNARSTKGRTPLMTVDDPFVIRALGAHGADPTIWLERFRSGKDFIEGTALLMAVKNDESTDIIEAHLSVPGVLVNASAIPSHNGSLESPLGSAKSIRVLKILLSHGANPRLYNNPLRSELARTNPEATRILLEAGAQPDGSSDNPPVWSYGGVYHPSPVLHYVASVEVARLLLEAGADLHQKDGVGFTAKQWAKAHGKHDLVALYRSHKKRNLAIAPEADRPSPPPPPPPAKRIKTVCCSEAAVAAPSRAVNVERKDSVCIICMDAAADVVLFPCRHMCLCKSCHSDQAKGDNMGTCPICRALIRNAVHIFH
jgi:ankyrin repeat protein